MLKRLAAPCAAVLLVAGCAAPDNGATFSFHSPGGQVEIFYDEAERCLLYTSPSPRD